ncbi:hypothetical protein Taro_037902 [Colocasia esculenta]|uniref:polyribonucleotide nucleotidyltransferase n=1 Tax=Colocasia esculenta TaxID=4460 RepID=A0A843WKM4_COLES|nr:hypothetical protein [Colocasia esculenta]
MHTGLAHWAGRPNFRYGPAQRAHLTCRAVRIRLGRYLLNAITSKRINPSSTAFSTPFLGSSSVPSPRRTSGKLLVGGGDAGEPQRPWRRSPAPHPAALASPPERLPLSHPLLPPWVPERARSSLAQEAEQGSSGSNCGGLGEERRRSGGGRLRAPAAAGIRQDPRRRPTCRMGRQASASVTVTDGETIVYTTVCLSDVPSEPSDFFPLSVHYQERLSAAGRTSGGFFKREGKTKDHEVLICRLIDRPLRTTMPKGFYYETQILSWVRMYPLLFTCTLFLWPNHVKRAKDGMENGTSKTGSSAPHYGLCVEKEIEESSIENPAQERVFSYDGIHSPDCLAVTAAGIAVALSEVPNSQMIAGVRVGLVGDRFIVNPTTKEMEESELDLILAGTESAIFMIEGYCNFLPEEKLLQAVEVGQTAVRGICKEVQALVRKCGKQKMIEAIRLPPAELYRHVEEISGDELIKALQIKSKIPRRKTIAALEEKVIAILTEDGYVVKDGMPGTVAGVVDVEDEDEDEVVVDGEVDEGDVHIKPIPRKILPMFFSEVDVKLVFKEVSSKFLRKRIVEGARRSDGRSPWEIRPINSQCGLLPRAHGSALFTRGETQSLAVVTLGDKQMAQRIDNLVDTEEHKKFYLQYSFPPSCVGEAGRVGAPSRREIGHGMLAERALEPILPLDENFPYTVRVESTITESNGSSSMASVCGGCLALLDAGVPVKGSVAGIAMGMVLDTKEFGGDGTPLILSDITGAEDASGDMDFKVAGDENGITAFQMDIKVGGITLEVMERALLQARDGRKHILCWPTQSCSLSIILPCHSIIQPFDSDIDFWKVKRYALPFSAEMLKCSPPPSRKLSKHAPLIHVMKVKPDKVNAIIGTGGKKVKSIIEETGVEAIETQDDGIVKITARDLLSLEKSKAIIANLTMVPTVGDIYRNCEIKSIAPYGVFVEIAPGREGLCHISELSSSWLAKAEDVRKVELYDADQQFFVLGSNPVVKVGDRLDINEKGHLRLSRRALLPDEPVDQTNVKGDTSEQVKGSTLPQIAADSAKMTKFSAKDGLVKQGAEQPKNVTKVKNAVRKPSSPKEVIQDKSPDRIISQEKDIRRLSSSAKNGPYITKDGQEQDNDKLVSEANTSIDGTSIISGEAGLRSVREAPCISSEDGTKRCFATFEGSLWLFFDRHVWKWHQLILTATS